MPRLVVGQISAKLLKKKVVAASSRRSTGTSHSCRGCSGLHSAVNSVFAHVRTRSRVHSHGSFTGFVDQMKVLRHHDVTQTTKWCCFLTSSTILRKRSRRQAEANLVIPCGMPEPHMAGGTRTNTRTQRAMWVPEQGRPEPWPQVSVLCHRMGVSNCCWMRTTISCFPTLRSIHQPFCGSVHRLVTDSSAESPLSAAVTLPERWKSSSTENICPDKGAINA